MRLRNSTTGTVISVGDEAAQRYQNAGWSNPDATSSTMSSRSTSESGEDEDPKPRRRRTSR